MSHLFSAAMSPWFSVILYQFFSATMPHSFSATMDQLLEGSGSFERLTLIPQSQVRVRLGYLFSQCGGAAQAFLTGLTTSFPFLPGQSHGSVRQGVSFKFN
jgi:hypothetical protein